MNTYNFTSKLCFFEFNRPNVTLKCYHPFCTKTAALIESPERARWSSCGCGPPADCSYSQAVRTDRGKASGESSPSGLVSRVPYERSSKRREFHAKL